MRSVWCSGVSPVCRMRNICGRIMSCVCMLVAGLGPRHTTIDLTPAWPTPSESSYHSKHWTRPSQTRPDLISLKWSPRVMLVLELQIPHIKLIILERGAEHQMTTIGIGQYYSGHTDWRLTEQNHWSLIIRSFVVPGGEGGSQHNINMLHTSHTDLTWSLLGLPGPGPCPLMYSCMIDSVPVWLNIIQNLTC